MPEVIKPDHDAQIIITLKAGHLNIAAPLDNPALCRELLCLAISEVIQHERRSSSFLNRILQNGNLRV